MNVKSSGSIWVARRAGLLVGLGLSSLAALTLCAKDGPNISVSDRAVDRSVRGASFSPVIKRVQPSVVTIYSTRTTKFQSLHPFFDDPRFRRFFGDSGKRVQQGLGSGVVVTEDGYILTNNHVIEGADADGLKIVLADGKTEHKARIIGTDPGTDVAVIKVDGVKLTPITFADSEKIEVGDVVFAIGNPFGVGQSVSMGIVSAVGRGSMPFGNILQYEDFIQTDAAINKGNSGGALVDAEGRLIGINQSIVSQSGGSAGVGFAIPSNLSRTVLEALATNGKIARGFLGIEMQPEISQELAKEFGLPDASGVLVIDVVPDSAAAKAGVKRDDVIVEFNGKKIADRRQMRLIVSQTQPATRTTLKVIRDGKERVLNVTVGGQPQTLTALDSGDAGEIATQNPGRFLEGVEIANLDRAQQRPSGLPENLRGVVLTKVDPDSFAADAELSEGDIILEVNRRPVRDVSEAVSAASGGRQGRILLRVYSQNESGGGTTYYVSVQKGKK